MAFLIGNASAATFAPTKDELEASKHKPDAPQLELSAMKVQVDSSGRRFYAVDDMHFDAAAVERDAGFTGNNWPQGILYYTFDPSVSSANRTKWINAAALWSAVAPVSFVQGTGVGHYVLVKAASGDGSFIGMVGGRQEMHIASWHLPMIIAHEIGHALGLLHEHSRSDRDSYISVLWSNISSGASQQFTILGGTNYGQYDFDSVMHYPRGAHSHNGQNTIEPRPDYWEHLDTMGERTQLSPIDGQGLAYRYGRSNDMFAHRFTLLRATGSVTGSNGTATTEPGEPNHSPGLGRSVWYSWQAPATEPVRFYIPTSQVIAVYTGQAVSDLTLVARSGSSQPVDFTAVAGTWYQIAVDATSTSPYSEFTLHWWRFVPPPNDNFSNAQTLTGETGRVDGNNGAATIEPGEPNHGSFDSRQSVWYAWTAPATGTWHLTAQLGGSYRTPAVYTGTSVSNLTRVGSDNLWAIQGRTYHIAIYGSGGGPQGGLNLIWQRQLSQYGTKGDVDGNRVADFLWQNTRTGERAVWKLWVDGQFIAGHYLQTVAPEWRIAGSADFNSDGMSDLIWQNIVTGERVIWFLRDGQYFAGIYLQTIPPEWEIASAADFNADKFADVVWQNTRTGERVMWFLRDGVFQSGIYMETIPPEWRIAGAGDFNFDAHADLVWQNINTGERVMWFLRNGLFQSGSYLQTIAPEWRIAATADFNYDGYADFAWQNINTGERVMWFLRNGVFQSGKYLQTIDPEWDLATH